MNKFKVGDKVEFIGDAHYEIIENHMAEIGEVYTISMVSPHNAGSIGYEFKECYCGGNTHTHWYQVDNNFRLHKEPSWREILK